MKSKKEIEISCPYCDNIMKFLSKDLKSEITITCPKCNKEFLYDKEIAFRSLKINLKRYRETLIDFRKSLFRK